MLISNPNLTLNFNIGLALQEDVCSLDIQHEKGLVVVRILTDLNCYIWTPCSLWTVVIGMSFVLTHYWVDAKEPIWLGDLWVVSHTNMIEVSHKVMGLLSPHLIVVLMDTMRLYPMI